MSEPATPTGRRVLTKRFKMFNARPSRDHIVAIEQEAREEERDRLRRRLRSQGLGEDVIDQVTADPVPASRVPRA